jgi:TolA-binding protein
LHPKFDESNNATRKGIADLELTIKNMVNDLSAIRAQTQDSGTRLGSLSDEIEALRRTLESLPAMLSQQPLAPAALPADPNAPPVSSTTAPGVPPSGAVPAPLPPVSSSAGLSPQRMLGTAKGDYFSGQYSLALSGFEAVIRNFPGTQAAAEAQYYMGETYYADNKWPEAIAAYDLLIQTYPRAAFGPEAYYKKGLAQERAGQPDAARVSWEFAVKTFPDTDGGRLARQGLDRLSRQSPPRP